MNGPNGLPIETTAWNMALEGVLGERMSPGTLAVPVGNYNAKIVFGAYDPDDTIRAGRPIWIFKGKGASIHAIRRMHAGQDVAYKEGDNGVFVPFLLLPWDTSGWEQNAPLYAVSGGKFRPALDGDEFPPGPCVGFVSTIGPPNDMKGGMVYLHPQGMR